jgi:hypothetical protein
LQELVSLVEKPLGLDLRLVNVPTDFKVSFHFHLIDPFLCLSQPSYHVPYRAARVTIPKNIQQESQGYLLRQPLGMRFRKHTKLLIDRGAAPTANKQFACSDKVQTCWSDPLALFYNSGCYH